MAKNDNFFSEMYLFWRSIFCGNDKMTSIFSFKGTLNRSLGWGTAIILSFLLQSVTWLNIEIVTYLFSLIIFYCVLALTQKRCRDFGSSGTLWVIFVSIVMLLETLVYFFNTYDTITLYPKLQQYEKILYCFLIIPLLIPSKPKPDLSLRSPLLKYPFVYAFLCWMFAIIATLSVSYFANIEK